MACRVAPTDALILRHPAGTSFNALANWVDS